MYKNAARTGDVREELEVKNMQLLSVQRNYESMSRLMQVKQEEIEQLRTQLDEERATVVSLSVQLDDMLHRAEVAEGQVERLRDLPAQLTELTAAHEKLKYENSIVQGKYSGASERMARMERATERAELESENSKAQGEAAHRAEAAARAETEAVRKQLAESQGDCRALMSELRASKDSAAAAQQQAQTAEYRAVTLSSNVSSLTETVASLKERIRQHQQREADMAATYAAQETSLATARAQAAVAEGKARSTVRALELETQQAAELRQREAGLRQDVDGLKSQLAAAQNECAKLTTLLHDTEVAYQHSLTSKLQADEVLAAMQLQVASTRGVYAETKRQLQDQAEAHAVAIEEARAAMHSAMARASDAEQRFSHLQNRSSEFMSLVITKVEYLSDRLSVVASRVSRDLAEALARHEKTMGVLVYKMGQWEASTVAMEEHVLHVAGGLQVMHQMAVSRHAEASRRAVQFKKKDGALQARVAELSAALNAEKESRQLLAVAQRRAEKERAAALAAAQASADEALEAERQRLGAQLAEVRGEVERLQRTFAQDRAATSQLIELEKAQLSRQVDALKGEVKRLEAEMVRRAAEKNEEEQRSLAVLSTQHHLEVSALRSRLEAQIESMTKQLSQCRGNLGSAWSVTHTLLSDMSVVAGHLVKMGWACKPCDAGLELRGVTEDGGGDATAKAVALARLHFAHITEAMQGAAKEMRRLQKQPSTDWTRVAGSLRGTVAKLLHVEEALASSVTCLACMDTYRQPLTCIPCGHTYCASCLESAAMRCQECGGVVIKTTIRASALDAIASKAEYKMGALRAIQEAVMAGAAEVEATAAAARQHR